MRCFPPGILPPMIAKGLQSAQILTAEVEPMRVPVLQGVLPIERSRVPGDALAGLTLAAIGVPEVLGYAKIAGMPLVTGLYTMLLPMAAFAGHPGPLDGEHSLQDGYPHRLHLRRQDLCRL